MPLLIEALGLTAILGIKPSNGMSRLQIKLACPEGPDGFWMFLGPPIGLLLRALEELVGVLHWRVPGSALEGS